MASGAGPLNLLIDAARGVDNFFETGSRVLSETDDFVSGRSTKRDKKRATDAQRAITDKQESLIKEREDRVVKEASDTKKRKRVGDARRRQRSRGSKGRRSTFLTGPSGLSDEGSGDRKTLLGS